MLVTRSRFFFAALLSLAAVWATAPAWAQPPRDDHDQDRAAIRRTQREYLTAVHQGRAERVANFWTPNGVFIDAEGNETRGRDLAKRLDAERREERGEAPRQISDSTIRFVTQNVAVEDGYASWSEIDVNSEWLGRFTAIWVRHEGDWQLDSVRESHVRKTSPHDYLRGLTWLVGRWQNDSGDVHVDMNCHWSHDRNFLLRDIRIQPPEGPEMTIHQRIGWDASKRQIRAWTFDSSGGHGDSVWTLVGSQLMTNGKSVTPEGEETAAQSNYTALPDGSFSWESTQSRVAGVEVPGHKLHFVRKPVER